MKFLLLEELNVIVHIIEHFPKGTIYRLVKPLEYWGQRVVYTPEDISCFGDLLQFPKDTIFVLHITGRMSEVFVKFSLLLKYYTCALFLHVSLSYMKFQCRDSAIIEIKRLYSEGAYLLSPCNHISAELKQEGMNSVVIQLGIESPQIGGFDYLKQYCGKIITCCSESTLPYMNIKGIHDFQSYIENFHLESQSLIVGSSLPVNGILSVHLSHNEFMYVLKHSKLYVQFSRFESYNVTAIEAKQLKVPVVLLRTEGVVDNLKYGYVGKDYNEVVMYATAILNDISKADDVIEKNYIDSIERETTQNFANSIFTWSTHI